MFSFGICIKAMGTTKLSQSGLTGWMTLVAEPVPQCWQLLQALNPFPERAWRLDSSWQTSFAQKLIPCFEGHTVQGHLGAISVPEDSRIRLQM